MRLHLRAELGFDGEVGVFEALLDVAALLLRRAAHVAGLLQPARAPAAPPPPRR
jgi:hypothetical protein